jgi:hypothetical protein
VRRACRVAVLAASIFGDEVLESRFFTPHPRTYPKELTLFGAPETFGGPFVQNDTAGFRGIAEAGRHGGGNYEGSCFPTLYPKRVRDGAPS